MKDSGDNQIRDVINIEIDNLDIDEYANIDAFFKQSTVVIKKDSLYPQVIDDFYATNTAIVLADRSYTRYIHCYQLDGSLLWRKRADPNDPFTFSSIGQIYVYENDDRLEVFDEIESVFYYYELLSGDFLGKEYYGLDFNTKMQVSPNLYVFSKFGMETGQGDAAHDASELYFVDTLDYLGSQLRYDPVLNQRPLYIPDVDFVKTNNSLTYFRPFSDSLYEIQDTLVWPIATITFSANSLPKSIQSDPKIPSLFQFSTTSDHPFVRSICKSNQYYFVIYQYKENGAFAVVSESGVVLVNSRLVEKENRFTAAPFLMKNNKMISVTSRAVDELITKSVTGLINYQEDKDLVESINNDRDVTDLVINIFTIQ